MKTKTSLTLSQDVLDSVGRLMIAGESRSAAIERILRRYVEQRKRRARHARELARINKVAERLNAETRDVLGFQADT